MSMTLSEYNGSVALRTCKRIRHAVPEAIGAIRCGIGLAFQGILFEGAFLLALSRHPT